MKICAMSDMHGHEIPVPKCDVLAIAGDISRAGDVQWFYYRFVPWLKKYKNKFSDCFLVFGNHDDKFLLKELEVPEWLHILTNKGYTYHGYIFYGTPYIPHSDEIIKSMCMFKETKLKKAFDMINPHTDVLITHSPPYGIGDVVKGQNYHLGSTSLAARVYQIKPKVHIFGHIHTGKKFAEVNGTRFYNVSVLDEQYNVAYKPMRINL